jgi:pimeloyl-ACP methyl ester carboxylesterase
MSTVTAIVPISGFTERNRMPIGMRTLWRDDLRPFSGPTTFVHPPVPWTHDPRDILGLMEDVGATELIIVAYSWGVGYGARRLVAAAHAKGMRVRLVLSCDGVWRSTFLRALSWISVPLAMTSCPAIHFDGLVNRIVGVCQRQTRPVGHDIYRGANKVQLTRLDATHINIDEHPEWRSLATQAIRQTLQTP